ncbi:hypothetical protein ACHAXM_009687 [Skeletonema potamos]
MMDADDVALSQLGIEVNWTNNTPGNSSLPSKKGLVDQMPYSAPSGLDSLKKFVNSNVNNQDDVRQKSKHLLRNLLASHGVSVSPESLPSACDNNKKGRYNQLLLSSGGDDDTYAIIAARDVSIRGLSDRAVAELTCESRTSLFGSILRLYDMHRGDVGEKNNQQQQPPQQQQQQAVADPMIMDAPILSTAEIVRSVHLTASPGDIPAGMDSKEYTQAALHFLSSNVPFISENESEYRKKDNGSSSEGWEMLRKTLPVLPLIKAINPDQSLENRSYGRVRPLVTLGESERKQYPDSVDDDDMEFRRKVLNLERIFTSSLPFPMKEFKPLAFQKYMPRRKLVPRIEGGGAKEELTLMISGHMQQPHNPPGPKTKASTTLTQTLSMVSSPAASSDANSTTNTPITVEKSSQSEAKPSSDELNTYMDKWVSTHAPMNLMPSLKQKETIIQETGVDKKRLESWFYRARKKMKRSHTDVANPAPPVTKAYSDLLNAATQAPSTKDSSAMEIDNATPTNKASTESNEDDTFKA